MPRALVPSVLYQFQGRRDFPPEAGLDDWGLTPAQQESYVEQFRRLLASRNAWREDRHDYYMLRRFLRARSYDLEKAVAMWMNNLKFKAEFGVDTILQDFVFQERDAFLVAWPQGYHKTDKMGRPIYIQFLGAVKIDKIKEVTTEERMIKFHIQEYERACKVILPVCSHLAGRNIDMTFGIMDVKGVGISHLTGEVKRLLGKISRYDQDNYPEMLGHICIINAPSIFRVLWNAIKGLLDPRTQGKIEILGTDYKPGLLRWVDEASLPDWLGGKSQGSLLDDVGPWSDPEVLARLGLDLEQLRQGTYRPAPALVSMASARLNSMRPNSLEGGGPQPQMLQAPSLRRHSDMSDGYHSPINSSSDLSMFRSADMQHKFSAAAGSLVVSTSMQRPGPAGSSIGTGVTLGPAPGGFIPIPEQASVSAGGARAGGTLVHRVAALEELLGPYKEQLSALTHANGLVNSAGEHAAMSTKSAPQGSLLYRVELLEEAMNVLLAANQALLLQQRQEQERQQQLQQQLEEQQRQQQQQQRQAKSRACCGCTVM